MTKAINERELVLGILMEITEGGKYSHIVLREVLGKYQYLAKHERAFITRVTEGTLERTIELDYIIDCFSKVKVRKMKPVIRNILRSSVYQLKYMDQVPASAVCNEAVKLAAKKGFVNLKGFVNGVLRNVARNLDQIVYPDMSVTYSMPEWIVKQWLSIYDRETVERMLQDFLRKKPITIRLNPERMSKEELLLRFEEKGVTVEGHPYLPYAFCISGYDYLADLPGFTEGAFYVQDISSMLVAEIAAPKENDRVIDVCAAPGGKALHMAQLLGGTGHVEARDLTEYKVELIRENIHRAGLANVEAVRQDATELSDSSVEAADIVIADLPCSGLGVLSKKTDLKYKMTEEMQSELVQLQRRILSQVKQYVRPGGVLVYSTCTIHDAENMGNVHWFLEENKEFELMPIQDRLCEELKKGVTEEGCLQLLPGIHKSDGFFIAKFRKGSDG